jgi:hypothetical protein
MPIIRDIQKLVLPQDTRDPTSAYWYIEQQPYWIDGTWVETVELGKDWGGYVGTNGVTSGAYLQATILSTTLVIPVTSALGAYAPFALSIWPTSGYFMLGSGATAEIIGYTSINPSSTSASGFDEFVVPSTAYRGMKHTTAAGHTGGASALITEILYGSVVNIEHNTETRTFNTWSNSTQGIGSLQSYGADIVDTVTSHLIPIMESGVTLYELQSVTS